MLPGFDKQNTMLHQGVQCRNSSLYTQVERKQDTEHRMNVEPFLTQTKQLEAGAVMAKLCQQQLRECSGAVAEIAAW